MAHRTAIYGLVAEFENPPDLLRAVRQVYGDGYRSMDAYTPYPVEELAESMGFHRSRMPLVMLIGGLVGCIGGFLMQYWCAAIAYPINVAGRPLNTWPSWIPVTFELTVLISALSGIFGLLGLCGLPRPHHPLFNVERFALATRDRFFLCIEATDPKFDREGTRQYLAGLHPREVTEVPH
jgi:ActD protein